MITHEQIETSLESSVEQKIDYALNKLGIAEAVPPNLREFINDIATVSADVGAAIGDEVEFIGTETHGFEVDKIREVDSEDFKYLTSLNKSGPLKEADIHFNPSYIDESGNIHEFDFARTAQTAHDKMKLMLQGMEGVITYLTLVEAGFVPKPDIVYGSTNKQMALFAEHVGLPRQSTWMDQYKYSHPDSHIPKLPFDDWYVYNIYEDFRGTASAVFRESYGKLSVRYAGLKARAACWRLISSARVFVRYPVVVYL